MPRSSTPWGHGGWPVRAIGTSAALAVLALAGLIRAEPPADPAPAPPAPAAAQPAAEPIPNPLPGAKTPSRPAAKEEPEVQLYLVDGRRFTGFLVEQSATEYILRIAGIRTPFRASQVQRFVVLPPVMDRYRELRAAIDEDDADQILRLTEWLIARRQLDTALAELDALLKRMPENAKAVRARTQLLRQIDLRDKSRPIEPEDAGVGTEPPLPDTEPPLPAGALASFPYLSETDIARMKVFEIDLNRPPRLEIPRETISALLESHGGHPSLPTGREGREGLYRLPAREQLLLLFKVRARELYSQVRVLDQPETMRLFRDEVQRTWLLPQCATTACHGGTEAGRLILANRRPNSDATTYTNFYIVQNFRTADGSPLLNFDEPEKSVALQMALPREDALVKHPRVLAPVAPGAAPHDAWKPAFRSRDEARFQQAIAWLKSAYRPRPDYGINYTPARPFVADQAKRPDTNDPGR
ncbi:MAG: hypothetical protein AB7K52_02940 [Phycisphaerales bacterium]